MRIPIFILFLAFSSVAHAQIPTEGQLSSKLDYAVDLINTGKYQAADKELQYIMNNMEKLPSDLAFHFGRNSFHLEKYKQSINWLNKYIQLKGTKGRYYESASEYLQLAEEEYLKISRAKTQHIEDELSGSEYDCGGLEKMICPVCHGDGVILIRGDFDYIYKTCPYSLGESYLSCEEYNLFMKGLLDPKTKN